MVERLDIAPGVRLFFGPAPGLRNDDAVCVAFHANGDVALGAITFLLPEATPILETRLVLVVASEALARLGAGGLGGEVSTVLLPSRLREVVTALLRPVVLAEAREVYQTAKALELLCELLRLHVGGELLPLAGDGALSAADTQRVMAARRLIEERCAEKLTLEAIARSCGLNRSKLTKGYRELFGCSVAEAIAERRLERASRMLISTDMPVSSVGYKAGYLNNASFARAFGRRFGRTPTDFRAQVLAA